jgi:hypothetical protein
MVGVIRPGEGEADQVRGTPRVAVGFGCCTTSGATQLRAWPRFPFAARNWLCGVLLVPILREDAAPPKGACRGPSPEEVCPCQPRVACLYRPKVAFLCRCQLGTPG